jgi:hypothetical protein
METRPPGNISMPTRILPMAIGALGLIDATSNSCPRNTKDPAVIINNCLRFIEILDFSFRRWKR